MASSEETAEKIYSILERCLSENAEVRRQAEEELRSAEDGPDFFASLVMIAAAGEDVTDSRVRWLAAVCGKNAVPRSWRRGNFARRSVAVSEEEREYVRASLLSMLGTKESRSAVQISVWISRIARIDYPKSWPFLIESLAERMAASDTYTVCHALRTLDMVFKQLASRRLLADRKSFRDVAANYFRSILALFERYVIMISSSPSQVDMGSPNFLIVERCLKTFRRLIVDGMSSISGVEVVGAMFTLLKNHPTMFFAGLNAPSDFQNRLSILTAKLVLQTQHEHPLDFHEYLSHFLELYYLQLLQFSSSTSSERLGFLMSKFLRNVAQSSAYNVSRDLLNTANSSQGSSPGLGNQIGRMVFGFFDQNRTKCLLEVFLTRLFKWSALELDTWKEDPETLLKSVDAAEWGEDNLRHECEELLRIFLNHHRDFVTSVILEYTKSLPLSEALSLDACYRAIGICVYDWDSRVNFEDWFNSQLSVILASPCGDIGATVLKARAAWLTGQFVGQLSREGRVKAFQLLVPLLSLSQQDAVVALSSARALQVHVEDLGFFGSDFAPFLSQCLNGIFAMSAECEEIESKRNLLGFASGLVERCPLSAVTGVCDPIANALCAMWDQSKGMNEREVTVPEDAWNPGMSDGGQNLYRTSLVMLLTCVLRKLGPIALSSSGMRRLVLHAVEFGISLDGEDSGGVYMMDEACELWETLLNSSESYDDHVASLYANVQIVLANDYDNLKVVYRIIEGYALLGQVSFMRQYGALTQELLIGALHTLRDRGCLATCEVVDVILQLFPTDGPVLFSPLLQELLRAVSNGIGDVLGAAYLCLLLRSMLTNPHCLETSVLKDETSMGCFMDLALEKLDSMYLVHRRKLAALALCGIVVRHGRTSAAVQARVPGVLRATVQVLSELNLKDDGGDGTVTSGDFENYVSRTGEDDRISDRLPVDMPGSNRRRELASLDIAVLSDLKAAARETLSAVQMAGTDRIQQIFAATDLDVVAQLQGFLAT